MNNKYLEAIEKLASGYEYEEIQTQVEETSTGTKKKIIKIKKHVPPNFQAARYLIGINNKYHDDKGLESLPKEEVETFNKEVF
ncbi:MAG: hypothetical protein MJ245_00300 [Clostridia bacterium]|nr:hypothetical protein [Clostridia bacterium]